jgi:hypothetical protein
MGGASAPELSHKATPCCRLRHFVSPGSQGALCPAAPATPTPQALSQATLAGNSDARKSRHTARRRSRPPRPCISTRRIIAREGWRSSPTRVMYHGRQRPSCGSPSTS